MIDLVNYSFLSSHLKLFQQLLGWAAFGTFLILKGAWLNSQSELADTSSSYHAPSAYLQPGYHQHGRTFASTSLTEDFGGKSNKSEPLNYTIPYMDKYLVSKIFYFTSKINYHFLCAFCQGLDLTFPVDNSLQECYNRRASCVNNDWGAEVTTNHYKIQNIVSNSHQCQCQVGHLLGRVAETGSLMSRWLEFGEKLMSLSSLDGDNVDVVDVDPDYL